MQDKIISVTRLREVRNYFHRGSRKFIRTMLFDQRIKFFMFDEWRDVILNIQGVNLRFKNKFSRPKQNMDSFYSLNLFFETKKSMVFVWLKNPRLYLTKEVLINFWKSIWFQQKSMRELIHRVSWSYSPTWLSSMKLWVHF